MKWWAWVLVGFGVLYLCRAVARNSNSVKSSDVDAMPNNTAA